MRVRLAISIDVRARKDGPVRVGVRGAEEGWRNDAFFFFFCFVSAFARGKGRGTLVAAPLEVKWKFGMAVLTPLLDVERRKQRRCTRWEARDIVLWNSISFWHNSSPLDANVNINLPEHGGGGCCRRGFSEREWERNRGYAHMTVADGREKSRHVDSMLRKGIWISTPPFIPLEVRADLSQWCTNFECGTQVESI